MLLAVIGLIAGIWSEKFDHLATVTNFIIAPLAFLSGTFYSVKSLPAPWNEISLYNPFFYIIDGFRYGSIGVADSNLFIGALLLAALNLILLFVAYRMLASGYRLKA